MQNYIFFFNNRFIRFTESVPANMCNLSNETIIINLNSTDDTSINYSDFFLETNNQNWIIICSGMLKKVIKHFLKGTQIIRAGGGIIKNSENKFLFIYRNNFWDLPKGKPELQETIQETAIREVKEECGFTNIEITKFIQKTFHLYIHKGVTILKKTYWFEMFAAKYDALVPQAEEGITEIRWVAPEDVEAVIYKNTYPNVKLLMQNYLGDIKKEKA